MFDKIIEIYVVVQLLWVKLNKLQRNKNRHQQGQTTTQIGGEELDSYRCLY